MLNLRGRCGLSQVAVPPCGSWWRLVKVHKADSCSSGVDVRAHRVIAVRQARVWCLKDGRFEKARFRFTHCNTSAKRPGAPLSKQATSGDGKNAASNSAGFAIAY